MIKQFAICLLSIFPGIITAAHASRARPNDHYGVVEDQASAAIVAQAEALSWSTKEAGPLRALFARKEVVQTIANYFFGSEVLPAHLGNFRLADLNNDGQLELVVSMDFSGRGFYNMLGILTCKRKQMAFTYIDAWNINDLDQVIKDLDHDGRKELLVNRMPHYRGADTIPGFPDIYQYDGSTLIQVDRQFKDYYLKQQLPRIQKDLVDLRAAAAEIQKQVTTAQNKLGQEKLAAGEQESLHDELNHNTSILENCRGNIVDLQAQIDEIHYLFGD
jgi:hypothetical protein